MNNHFIFSKIYIHPSLILRFYVLMLLTKVHWSKAMLTLPNRLASIIHMIPSGSTVADIGADHGLLSLYLSQHCRHVIATDVSASAIQGVRSIVDKYNISNKVTIYKGYGLVPLIENNHNVDTLILSGMGIGTIGKILSGLSSDCESDSVDDELPKPSIMLSTIEPNQIILQPWPPHLIPYLKLIELMNRGGWKMTSQTISKTGKAHFINCSFHKTNDISQTENSSKSLTALFQGMPLAQENSNGRMTTDWRSYVNQQFDHLSCRLNGISKSYGSDKYVTNALEISELSKLLNCLHRHIGKE